MVSRIHQLIVVWISKKNGKAPPPPLMHVAWVVLSRSFFGYTLADQVLSAF